MENIRSSYVISTEKQLHMFRMQHKDPVTQLLQNLCLQTMLRH